MRAHTAPSVFILCCVLEKRSFFLYSNHMPHIEIAAETLFTVFGFPVTNTLIMTWIVLALLVYVAFRISRTIAIIPKTLQNIFEMLLEAFLSFMKNMMGSRETAEKYVPIVATIFLFILISNWFGILPGVGSIGIYEQRHGERLLVPFFRSAASDLNVTLALGTIAVFLVNIMGMSIKGIGGHLSKYFTIKNPIDSFVGILEFVSEFAKIISFSFRLFGNIFAGEVLLIIVGFLMPFAGPVPFLFLELFVGFVQALVFAMLTMVFISIAIAHHH